MEAIFPISLFFDCSQNKEKKQFAQKKPKEKEKEKEKENILCATCNYVVTSTDQRIRKQGAHIKEFVNPNGSGIPRSMDRWWSNTLKTFRTRQVISTGSQNGFSLNHVSNLSHRGIRCGHHPPTGLRPGDQSGCGQGRLENGSGH